MMDIPPCVISNFPLRNFVFPLYSLSVLSVYLFMYLSVPPWLMKVTQKIYEETRLFPAPINHVLINEYLPNHGIMVSTKPSFFGCFFVFSSNSNWIFFFFFWLCELQRYFLFIQLYFVTSWVHLPFLYLKSKLSDLCSATKLD